MDLILGIVLLLTIGGIIATVVISNRRYRAAVAARPDTWVDSGKTNGLAIASLIVVFFSSIVGLVLGIVALGQVRRTGDRGHGLALAAVVIGWSLTVIFLIAGVFFSGMVFAY